QGEVLERGDQRVGDLLGGGQVDSGWEHVVRRLRGVDVIVGMDLVAQLLAGEGGEDLVHVHVRRGAGPGLIPVDRELVVPPAGRDLGGDVVDGGGQAAVDHFQAGVLHGGGALDRRQRP